MPVVLLAVVLIIGVCLIPAGLPGLWLIVAAAATFNWLTGTHRIGLTTVIGVALLAVVAEVLDLVLAARATRRYGGSSRAAWGAAIGGLAGALIGVPIPVEGSVVGALAGVFLGAVIAEVTQGAGPKRAVRAATGAVIGRVLASVAKVGIACVMAGWVLAAAW
ncbi:MAG TPA: DUF456 domain-containing protein [Gemmatimonadaceae bacterium]|jgi:uncharacterized protein YqgC (DUF456 family)|nr:DUF456 domain-containing protein [Gemmatimonadaceae bacterium]